MLLPSYFWYLQKRSSLDRRKQKQKKKERKEKGRNGEKEKKVTFANSEMWLYPI